MSTLLVEPATEPAQLYFTWEDSSNTTEELAGYDAGRGTSQTSNDSEQSDFDQWVAADPQPSSGRVSTLAQTPEHATTSATQATDEEFASHLSFSKDGRIERPVKIGSVMIRLLKRYGITDEEIAAGLQSYAEKNVQGLAG